LRQVVNLLKVGVFAQNSLDICVVNIEFPQLTPPGAFPHCIGRMNARTKAFGASGAAG